MKRITQYILLHLFFIHIDLGIAISLFLLYYYFYANTIIAIISVIFLMSFIVSTSIIKFCEGLRIEKVVRTKLETDKTIYHGSNLIISLLIAISLLLIYNYFYSSILLLLVSLALIIKLFISYMIILFCEAIKTLD